MNQVAKVIIIDNGQKYLLMKRASHPTLLDDPDLPGGVVEDGETPLEAAIREVIEEAGIYLDPKKISHAYSGADYSSHGEEYCLYITHLSERPEVVMSWEHKSFAWLNREQFLQEAREANDTYMHMVYEVVKEKY
jgi:8-oxo-dGTP pyrophosphatase MutT (NUDIX family)